MTARRGDAASRVAAELARERPGPSPGTTSQRPAALLLGDPAPHLALALQDSGYEVTRWHRFLTPGHLCTAWPPTGRFDEVWVRMPRSSREAAMLLHAAAARVDDGAPIHLYGASDEGIRSAARHFPAGAAAPHPALIKHRCRVLVAVRECAPPRPDGLEPWMLQAQVDWGAGERAWTFYPGVFAYGRVDPATALLIGCLPTARAPGRVLDFGAGTGVIGAAVLERGDGTEVHLLEPDAISLDAAARNVPGAVPVHGRDLSAVSGPFDLIVSNPPIHRGTAQSLHTVEALIRDAPAVLTRGGTLLLVAQRRLPVGKLLAHTLGDVRAVADHGAFRVWSGSATGSSPGAVPSGERRRRATARRGRSARRRP